MASGAWRVTAQQQLLTAARSMLDLFNDSSSRVYRVYRIWCFNNQYVSVTGAIGVLKLYRTLSANGGWPIAPISCDSNNSALDVNFSAGINRTISLTSLLRNITWSPEEVVAFTNNWNSLLTYVDFANIWDAGYGSSVVEPLTMRASVSEGYCLYCPVMAAGAIDVEAEFTDKAS